MLRLLTRGVPPPMTIAFTFPGQGSQKPGMGQPWLDHESWELVEEASEAAGPQVPRGPILERLCEALQLSTAERDRLYFAARRCPPSLSAVGTWDPAFALVADLLADPSLGPDDRAEFRQVLSVLVDRWRRSAG